MSKQEELLARLEAVATRLENAANKMGGGGGGDDGDTPSYVSEFQQIVNDNVKKTVAAAKGLGLNDIADILNSGYGNIAELVSRLPNAKKPDQQALLGFLKPGVDAIGQADSLRVKKNNEYNSFYQACYEGIMGISWVTMAPPYGSPSGHMEAQRDATMFHLNRILKTVKDGKAKYDGAKAKEFVDSFKELNVNAAKFVKNYFKTGVSWNPKGADLTSASAAAATTTSSKDDEKTSSSASGKKAGGGGGGGFDNVAAQLAGLKDDKARAAKLKKVTDDQKAKNRKDRSGKVTMKEAPKKAGRKKGAESIKFMGGRWMAENQNGGQHTIDKATLKQNVYICMGDDSQYKIDNKIKAITIDSCNKCYIIVNEVVSTIELVNCKSTTVVVEKNAPSISVDKCQSARIILMKEAFNNHPDIYTSNIQAMNVEVPGATDKDDPIEIPIPEQFLTKIDCKTKKATTNEVTHA